MNIIENSISYRWLAGSWFLGWLVAEPSNHEGYFQGSVAYHLADRAIRGFTRQVSRLGSKTSGWGDSSRLLLRPLSFLALFMFVAAVYSYSSGMALKGMASSLFLIVIGLILFLIEKYPGIYQGSVPGRAIKWWLENE